MCVLQRMAELEGELKRMKSMLNASDATKTEAIAQAKVSAHVHAWACMCVHEHACMSSVHTAWHAVMMYV